MRVALLVSLVVCCVNSTAILAAEWPAVLPGTQPLELREPLDEVMVAGLRKFCLREIDRVSRQRLTNWAAAAKSDAASFQQFREEKRQRLREILGVVDQRAARSSALHSQFHSERWLTPLEGHGDRYNSEGKVSFVRWDVLPGLTGEGALLDPAQARGFAIVIPDAENPLDLPRESRECPPRWLHLPLELQKQGCLTVLPALVPRHRLASIPATAHTNQSQREFLYRQSFELGRHIIGYEIQKVLALVDGFEAARGFREENADFPIILAGTGEGGLIALLAAAIDPRIDAALVRGQFQPREGMWTEPIDRNIWGFLNDFSDAELAALIAPRPLFIQMGHDPQLAGPANPVDGFRNGAAPGVLKAPDPQMIAAEYQRAASYYSRVLKPDSLTFFPQASQKIDHEAAFRLLAATKGRWLLPDRLQNQTPLTDAELRDGFMPGIDQEMTDRMFHQIIEFNQKLFRQSSRVRDARWKDLARSSPEKVAAVSEKYRDMVWNELIGRLPDPSLPSAPRTRLVISEPEYVGYEVLLDVHPDVIAGGFLLLPADLKPGEQRPVVVCQHGLEGTPRETIDGQAVNPKAFAVYKAFSAELVKRGFIVYAPQNPYRGGDRFRELQRMANPVGKSLFSFILCQHQQTLNWLKTLPHVYPRRIAFYGLSYGGKTAMRVPPLLTDYSLSICSGDFNEWILKNTTVEHRTSYLFTNEYEIFEWNMAHVANYAELAYLMAPRPFMVERGHDDGVALDEWVAWEYAKVRRHYVKLGLGDRTEIEFFNGPHTINGQGTFSFLHKHLNWPTR